MTKFVERVLPGSSECVRRLRGQLIDFALNPTARALLLRGPIGSGKSTIARCVALLKRVAPLTKADAERTLGLTKFSGHNQIDANYLTSWYVELALTGLVDSLADLQLFGSDKKAFTGAGLRPGVFESASTGHMGKGNEAVAAAITGGIVFLDEIGDLTQNLQAKLLPVLSGGIFYRLGTEGEEDAGLQFNGVILTASWRPLDGLLRPDLLSRIGSYTIDVPGIAERMEDFDVLLQDIEKNVIATMRARIDHMLKVDNQMDGAYWRGHRDGLKGLDQRQKEILRTVPWQRFGNMRGLTAAVEQIIGTGVKPELAVSRLPVMKEGSDGESGAGRSLLGRLQARPATGDGLGTHLRAIELEDRSRLRQQLQDDPAVLTGLARSLGLNESKVRSQLRTITRVRHIGDDER